MRTGTAQLPLHGGKAPRWLFTRMTRLAREVVCHVRQEFGPLEMLRRLSDPYWFQAFGCALGFDWHSSGLTTTTCGAIKEGIRGLEDDLGLFACGGKGAVSRRTPQEIERACGELTTSSDSLVKASRLSAKVDSAAVQDGYQLYHHAFFFTAQGEWCVVQQGLSDATGNARRYHWLGAGLTSFVSDPHAAVCCNRQGASLNLVAAEADASRTAMTELAGQPDRDVWRQLDRLPALVLPHRHPLTVQDVNPQRLKKVLLKTYEQPPADFQTLLATPGLGAKGLRALALTAELIYGTPASSRDPARFAFAHGGKDGTPYAVDRATYDHTISILNDALGQAKVARSDKLKALKRLARFSGEG